MSQIKKDKVGYGCSTAITICVLIFILPFILTTIINNIKLHNFAREISKLELPSVIEKIVIKSAIGDSGGNGNYSTLRVVMLIKTELSEKEIEREIKKTWYWGINKSESSIFESRGRVQINFKELEGLSNYEGYYFVEFIDSVVSFLDWFGL